MQNPELIRITILAASFCVFAALAYVSLHMRQRLKEERLSRAAEVGRSSGRVRELEERFRPIIDLDEEVAKLGGLARSIQSEIEALRASYADKKQTFDRLTHQLGIYDERLAFAEMGVYEPHFDYTDSEDYKKEILLVREKQKALVSSKMAVVCNTQWTVDGSAAKGQTMTNRAIRLTLRAFNNECEAAIANVRWNNANAMEKRINDAQEQIDKLNASQSVVITPEYAGLKLRELLLTHEYREKQRSEREDRAEAARAAREEQRLMRDLERAEEEEDRYRRLLARAQAEADRIAGPQLDAFNQQIQMLERDLAEAHARTERAQAMAERTRSGYIYIVSNIGSFGEDVVKIGLTRRLDPLDRIRELSGASVPFSFDIHAIVYSDDAPSLEHALHAEFDSVRVNAMNYRKEFFRATIGGVEAAVSRLAPGAPFFKDVEAQDYRETLAKRNAALAAEASAIPAFPDAL